MMGCQGMWKPEIVEFGLSHLSRKDGLWSQGMEVLHLSVGTM